MVQRLAQDCADGDYRCLRESWLGKRARSKNAEVEGKGRLSPLRPATPLGDQMQGLMGDCEDQQECVGGLLVFGADGASDED